MFARMNLDQQLDHVGPQVLARHAGSAQRTGLARNYAHGSCRRAKGRGGFTLLESMMALVIIGVGVLAFVDAQSSFFQSNNWSSRAATGMLLAGEIRELTRGLPRHDPATGLSISTGGGGSPVVSGWGRQNGEITIDDIDDIDDLDGMSFGATGTFRGPIDAQGLIVPEINLNGTQRLDGQGNIVPLSGWTQRVIVDKVDPYNFSTVRADGYEQVATSQLPRIAVDKFPLRVTVVVEFQGVGSTEIEEITRLTWIIPK